MPRNKYNIDWEQLTDADIVRLRVKDLHLSIPGSDLEPMIQRLYEELEGKGITFRPPCYLADEWLCPDKDPIIGIPFCLVHPRLKKIEMDMMFEVEGGHEAHCMKLLRHECGHAINYAYRLYTRTRWRQLFGLFSATYSDAYDYQPYSRRFVIHLNDHYAQAHPDEDFAETFAVWLTPDSQWRTKYQKWPALQKLSYIDHVMQSVRSRPPIVTATRRPPWAAARMSSTLLSYYQRKRRQLGNQFQGSYDDSLMMIFRTESHSSEYAPASQHLRRHRRLIIDNVTRWTGHRKYDIHQLFNRIITRCDILDLYSRDDIEAIVGIAALLSAVAGGTHRLTSRGKT